MKTYSISCKKYTANKNLIVRKKKKQINAFLKCAFCGKKKITFLKN